MSDRPAASRFVPGFVGVPGQRTFLIEVEDAGTRLWYLLEKGQVAALAVQSAELLAELGLEGAGHHIDPGPVSEPAGIQFRVASIELAFRDEEGLFDIILLPVEEDVPPALHSISPAQLDAAARVGKMAVTGGRPKCPKCGLAMDLDGHVCPTSNGDLRDHRP